LALGDATTIEVAVEGLEQDSDVAVVDQDREFLTQYSTISSDFTSVQYEALRRQV
jgi:flagellar biosynthesis/type III secretory pathway M-ring protein FliF/YscJ